MIKKGVVWILLYLPCMLIAQLSDFKTIDLTKADNIAEQYQGASLESLPILSYNLTNSLTTDVEKFRAIYTWVCKNIENDYYAFVKNKNGRQKLRKDSIKLRNWNISFSKKTFEKLKKEKKTVCTGYAYLIQEMAQFAGLKCEIINGYGRTAEYNIKKLTQPNHSWNAVYLNNKWYLCDATWSAGFYDINTNRFISNYNDTYFLTDPILFSKNHYPIDSKWLLTNSKGVIENFINGPIVYNSTHTHGVIAIQPKTLQIECKRGEEMTFYLQDSKPIEISYLSAELVSGSYRKANEITVTRLDNQLLEIKTTFQTKGTYDLHFKLNETYLITYKITIKKE
ncbi:hypothetical protein GOQ30_11000 [Flavobacterium sp. TP390]|uniref:Transglutaminase-like domain-containing protein n=1 Tax=Flavobacterium profundi TaxID=1774945 RepID=A0A6I4ISS4_9FLAO|nr:transglutaminase domain-containing protein [Flavobacterium profundi]MVO09687.1 hypothetical protein [Flavobacterium profundi]